MTSQPPPVPKPSTRGRMRQPMFMLERPSIPEEGRRKIISLLPWFAGRNVLR